MKNKKIIKIGIVLLISILIVSLVIYKTKKYSHADVKISHDSFSTTKDSIEVSMETNKGYKIYYTLDGSIPTKRSNLYRKKIALNKDSSPLTLSLKDSTKKIVGKGIIEDENLPHGTVLRAVAIAPNGTSGKVETRTYFIGIDLVEHFHKEGVVSIVTDPKNLIDDEIGIYNRNNYKKKGRDWEREAVIEFFDGEETSAWKDNIGIRIKGNITRECSQKSFNIYFRKEYGSKNLKYKLFEGNDIKKYKQLTLRNGGNAIDTLKFKDQWLQDLVRDRKVDTQAGRPVSLFINGEYWGAYDLQEKYNDTYYANHYDLEKDNIVVIKEGEVEEGKEEDIKLYEELMNYASLDLSEESIYQEFQEIVDIESLLDYYAIEIYIGNADWGNLNEEEVMKNTQLWRAREKEEEKEYGDGKWRFSLYDLEYSSSLFNKNNSKRMKSMRTTEVSFNSIERAKETQPLFSALMNNNHFRNDFYRTLREIGNNNFNPQRVEETLNETYNRWAPFMEETSKKFIIDYFDLDIEKENVIDYFNQRMNYIMSY